MRNIGTGLKIGYIETKKRYKMYKSKKKWIIAPILFLGVGAATIATENKVEASSLDYHDMSQKLNEPKLEKANFERKDVKEKTQEPKLEKEQVKSAEQIAGNVKQDKKVEPNVTAAQPEQLKTVDPNTTSEQAQQNKTIESNELAAQPNQNSRPKHDISRNTTN